MKSLKELLENMIVLIIGGIIFSLIWIFVLPFVLMIYGVAYFFELLAKHSIIVIVVFVLIVSLLVSD